MSSICPHQIEDESKNMKIQIRRALYDKKVAGHNSSFQIYQHAFLNM